MKIPFSILLCILNTFSIVVKCSEQNHALMPRSNMLLETLLLSDPQLIGLYGPPSSGKTSLATILASKLGKKIEIWDIVPLVSFIESVCKANAHLDQMILISQILDDMWRRRQASEAQVLIVPNFEMLFPLQPQSICTYIATALRCFPRTTGSHIIAKFQSNSKLYRSIINFIGHEKTVGVSLPDIPTRLAFFKHLLPAHTAMIDQQTDVIAKLSNRMSFGTMKLAAKTFERMHSQDHHTADFSEVLRCIVHSSPHLRDNEAVRALPPGMYS